MPQPPNRQWTLESANALFVVGDQTFNVVDRETGDRFGTVTGASREEAEAKVRMGDWDDSAIALTGAGIDMPIEAVFDAVAGPGAYKDLGQRDQSVEGKANRALRQAPTRRSGATTPASGMSILERIQALVGAGFLLFVLGFGAIGLLVGPVVAASQRNPQGAEWISFVLSDAFTLWSRFACNPCNWCCCAALIFVPALVVYGAIAGR